MARAAAIHGTTGDKHAVRLAGERHALRPLPADMAVTRRRAGAPRPRAPA